MGRVASLSFLKDILEFWIFCLLHMADRSYNEEGACLAKRGMCAASVGYALHGPAVADIEVGRVA